VSAADVANADVVIHHALHIALKVGLEQTHEEVDLSAGTAKVILKREGVECEPWKADARGGFRNELDAFGPLLMAEEALEGTMAGPAAVSIHDDGDMLGQALGLERRVNGALLRSQLIDAQGARRVQRTRLYVALAAWKPDARLERKGAMPRLEKGHGSDRPSNGGTLLLGQISHGRSKGAATSTLAQAEMGRNRRNEGQQREALGLVRLWETAADSDSKWAEYDGPEVQAVRRRPMAASRTAPYKRVR
jgi:hypothetical protein